MAEVTPWEVKGDVDYERLIKEFGIEPISKLPSGIAEQLLFRRGFIFAHRDFGRILDAIKHKKPFVMMTGLMPTGRFHIGHLLVAQQMRLFQELGAHLYICVADIEAYNARNQTLEESRKIALNDYIPTYLALGITAKNCTIYFQSERSSDAKKANAYYRLQNLFGRHATFNEFRAVYGEITPGKMVASLLQAADMYHPQLPEFQGPITTVIPVGVDQDPHIRLARDIAKRIPYKFISISSTYNRFLPGLSGGKMSASDPTSYIAVTDTPKDVEKKIKKYAFSGGRDTVEEHRRLGGNPDVDVCYHYLTFLLEDDAKLKQIHDDYNAGKMLTGELKEYAIKNINDFLKEHQKKREEAKKHIELLFPK
jgi:tryptophanyl-tRNA synthetase